MGLFGRKKPDETEAPAAAGAAAPTADVDLSQSEDAAEVTRATDAETAAAGPAAEAPFFRQPEAVSASKHGHLGIDRSGRGYAFARDRHLIPIAMAEFAQAALCYPITFAGERKIPCAVMGLQRGANVFISETGTMTREQYLPAYLRQYPFLLARDASADRSVLFIDRASDLVVENGGTKLFDGEQPSEFSRNALAFLMGLQAQWRETEQFLAALREIDAFKVDELKIVRRDGESNDKTTQPLVKYATVDMDNFAQFSHEQFQNFTAKKYFAAIYAQQLSLLNWPKVLDGVIQQHKAAA